MKITFLVLSFLFASSAFALESDMRTFFGLSELEQLIGNGRVKSIIFKSETISVEDGLMSKELNYEIKWDNCQIMGTVSHLYSVDGRLIGKIADLQSPTFQCLK